MGSSTPKAGRRSARAGGRSGARPEVRRETGRVPWSKLPTADAAGDGPEPTPLPRLLDAVLAGMGAPSAEVIVQVHEDWTTIVGAELAAHAQPLAIEDGCLRVGLDSPAWASHLRYST